MHELYLLPICLTNSENRKTSLAGMNQTAPETIRIKEKTMYINAIRFVSEKPLLYLDTRRYQCSRSALEITEYIAEAIRKLKEEGLVPTDRDWVENVAYRTAEYERNEGMDPLVDIIPEDCPEAEKSKPELRRIIDIDVRGPGIRLADYLVKADSYSSHIYPHSP